MGWRTSHGVPPATPPGHPTTEPSKKLCPKCGKYGQKSGTGYECQCGNQYQ
jgi:hypothetical protein